MSLSVPRHRRPRRGLTAGLASVVGIALVAGAAAAFVRWSDSGCADPAVAVTVSAAPDHVELLSRLADAWHQTEPAVGERCARVAVEPIPSSFAAATLSPEWDEERDGSRPDVWAPESSTWLAVAAARPDAATLLPASPPSLASSPVVLGMQRPMAEALGWPDTELGWADLLESFSRGRTWEQFGHPEWGPLRVGFPDPAHTAAGQAGVLTVLDRDDDEVFSDEELLAALEFSQLVTDYVDDTRSLLREYAQADTGDDGTDDGGADEGGTDEGGADEDSLNGDGTGAEDGGVAADLPAAFPVLEHELAAYAAGQEPASAPGGGVPLVPVYLREGVVYADYPYVVLDAPWVSAEKREAAAQFLAYLQGEDGRQAFTEAGYRDPAHSGAGVPLLAPRHGFAAQVTAPERVPTPAGLGEMLRVWPVVTRPNNVLIVLDTSGSMADTVPGTDETRLELLQGAALEGVAMLNNQTNVGLWEFSSGLTATTPYRELVPIGDLGGAERREALAEAIQGLSAAGATALYDTVYDAYLAMRDQWRPEALNMLMVITDGRNEVEGGRSLPQLLAELAEAVEPDRPLPIIALAVGPEADAAALQQITEVTGGRTIVARDEVAAIQQVVLAFAGRLQDEE